MENDGWRESLLACYKGTEASPSLVLPCCSCVLFASECTNTQNITVNFIFLHTYNFTHSLRENDVDRYFLSILLAVETLTGVFHPKLYPNWIVIEEQQIHHTCMAGSMHNDKVEQWKWTTWITQTKPPKFVCLLVKSFLDIKENRFREKRELVFKKFTLFNTYPFLL